MKSILWVSALLGLNCASQMDPAAFRLAGRHDVQVSQNSVLATPSMVSGNLADFAKIKKEKRFAPLLQFVKENVQLFKLNDPETELRLLRSDGDELGFTHYRYERIYKGIPVYGDELLLHVNAASQLYQANGNYHPSFTADVKPVLSAQKAGDIALEQGESHKMQKIDKTTLVLYPMQDGLRLTWHVILSGGLNKWDYFIDALNGAVLFEQDQRRF